MEHYLGEVQLTSSGADGAAVETQAIVIGSIDTRLAEGVHRTGNRSDITAIGAGWELSRRSQRP